MESAEQGRATQQFEMARHGVFPAVLTSVAGILGLVMVAAGPWLLLTSDAATSVARQPAFQAARAFSSAAVTRPVLFRTGNL